MLAESKYLYVYYSLHVYFPLISIEFKHVRREGKGKQTVNYPSERKAPRNSISCGERGEIIFLNLLYPIEMENT